MRATRRVITALGPWCLIWSLGCAGGGTGTDGTADGATGLDGSPGFDPTGDVGGTGQDAGTDGTDGEAGTDGVSGDDGTLLPGQICVPTAGQCLSDTEVKVCDADGLAWGEPTTCSDGQKCSQGQCVPVICTPGEIDLDCGGPTAQRVCNDLGTAWELSACPTGQTCFAGECVNYLCQPGSVACVGFASVQKCRDDGSAWDLVETCEKGGSCSEGACISACEVDLKAAKYTGCEYFAADLDNIEGGELEPVALVVSVPASVENALVSIKRMSDNHVLTAAELGASSLTVAAGSLGVFQLPAGQEIDGSGTWRASYQIQTSAPSTVHQFNPLNGEAVYTNDASLLLPTASVGTEYYVMSWPMRADTNNTLRGFAAVVASEPGQTLVTVTPRADVVGGSHGVDPIPAGSTVEFLLEQGEVLNLETDGVEGADLTGTRIVSTQAVVVFGGHECANVPLGINACDHLEQQLMPVAAWGSRYVADIFAPRSVTQFDVFRIMAGDTDVLVTTNPPQPGYEEFLLQPGSSVTFPATQSFEITATGRILVGHFMTGSSYPGHIKSCGNTGIGDPAFTLVPPTQQLLTEYTVLTPPGYVENYLNITAPSGAEITVDGQPLSVPLVGVGTGIDWGVARVPVSAGVHTVSGKKKFGLTAYGYDCDVSYAYPGGLRLLKLQDLQ